MMDILQGNESLEHICVTFNKRHQRIADGFRIPFDTKLNIFEKVEWGIKYSSFRTNCKNVYIFP